MFYNGVTVFSIQSLPALLGETGRVERAEVEYFTSLSQLDW